MAAVSLLAQRTPDFDPTAWLIWGRQLADGWLSTTGGPSWKPLPVMVTTALSAVAGEAAPALWLVVARAGGLLGLVMAYRLAARLGGGRTAGALAAAGLALATGYLWNAARGDSEGVLVALTLWAVCLHLDGRRRAALLAGTAAGLLRPEIWPLLAVYGLALARRERSARTVSLLAFLAAAVLALWLVPERVGGGDWLRAATRAQRPAEGAPGDSELPFVMTLVGGAGAVVWPLFAGAVVAVLAARRRVPRTEADRAVLALAAGAVAWTVLVGLMAEAGFTGALRYLTVPAAVTCVLGALGLPAAVRWARARPAAWARAAIGLVAGAGVAVALVLLGFNVKSLAEEGRRYGHELPRLVERAGGRAALLACGPLGADHFSRQAIAYRLRLRQSDMRLGTDRRARTVLAIAGTGAATEGRPPVVLRHGEWILRSDCAPPATSRR